MLDVTAFKRSGAQTSCDNHTVVIKDGASQTAILIVRTMGGLVEIMTPDMTEFKRTLGLLSTASGVNLTGPTEVKVDR